MLKEAQTRQRGGRTSKIGSLCFMDLSYEQRLSHNTQSSSIVHRFDLCSFQNKLFISKITHIFNLTQNTSLETTRQQTIFPAVLSKSSSVATHIQINKTNGDGLKTKSVPPKNSMNLFITEALSIEIMIQQQGRDISPGRDPYPC